MTGVQLPPPSYGPGDVTYTDSGTKVSNQAVQKAEADLDTLNVASANMETIQQFMKDSAILVLNGDPYLQNPKWNQDLAAIAKDLGIDLGGSTGAEGLEKLGQGIQDGALSSNTSEQAGINPFFENVGVYVSLFANMILSAKQQSIASKDEIVMEIKAMGAAVEYAAEIAKLKIDAAKVEANSLRTQAAFKFASAAVSFGSVYAASKTEINPVTGEKMPMFSETQIRGVQSGTQSLEGAGSSLVQANAAVAKAKIEALEAKMQTFLQMMQQLVSSSKENSNKLTSEVTAILNSLKDEISQLKRAFHSLTAKS